jgi:cytochrome c
MINGNSGPRTKLAQLALAAALMTGFGLATAAAEPLVEHGRALVEANCSACHATGPAGESPHRDAPPFRTLWQRYPLETLEEAFAEGIYTGHPDMPPFIASPEQIEAIIAYISALPRH